MVLAVIVVAGAALLAVAGYLRVEGIGLGAMVPAAARAGAWASVALLVLNPGCPAPAGSARPLVLLDGSLSMLAAGGHWEAARRAALARGDALLFGDPDRVLDSTPVAGASRLGPALTAAAASGRPTVVMSDGEITDAVDLPPDVLRRVEIRLFPRDSIPALAIQRLSGPGRVTPADTIRLHAELIARGLGDTVRSVRLRARLGTDVVTRTTVAFDGGRIARATLVLPPRAIPPGQHAVVVELADSLDPERRDDRRIHLLTVTATPGVVLVASPPDWDSRFLFRVLREVTDLPVEGFVELEKGRWRRMSSLADVAEGEVRRAFAAADLAIRYGAGAPRDTRAPALWDWGDAGGNASGSAGDWYLESGGPSPLAPALLGAPLDSFPPATGLWSRDLPDGHWLGLAARVGRRGAARPLVVGWEDDGRRVVLTLGQGLWRWVFRGGSSEQAYRALTAAAVDWLLGARPRELGRFRPVRRVVEAGRPLSFAWVGREAPEPVAVRFTSSDSGIARVDTLRFDGSGLATVRLEPGTYSYSAEGGPLGLVAVEAYSEEWFPRAVALQQSAGESAGGNERRRPRDEPWLYLLAVAGFAGEWVARRRLGMR